MMLDVYYTLNLYDVLYKHGYMLGVEAELKSVGKIFKMQYKLWFWFSIYINYWIIFTQLIASRVVIQRVELSWICCLTSQLTIFQSYMWRHIDVQADWRRSWTYGRAPNAIDISQGSLTCPS